MYEPPTLFFHTDAMLHVSLLDLLPSFFHVIYYLTLQNIEPDVTIDTVPNLKKQHEVNVGMSAVLLSTCTYYRRRRSCLTES